MSQKNLSDVGQYFPASMFNVDSFKNYNEEEFIEKLTYRLLNEVKKLGDEDQANSGELFNEIFQKSVIELDTLMKKVNIQTERLIDETENATQAHKKKLQNLNSELETVFEKFKNLEDCISKVGNTTVQIGNTLETVDKQKKRAIDAKKLMQYFEEFNKYDKDLFENEILPQGKIKFAIFKNKNTQHAAAKIIQQLNSIAKDLVKVPDCANGIANIQLYNSQLLNTLSRSFVQAIRMLEKDQDTAVAEMKKRAKILYDVKVGETCVELYVDNRFCRFLGVDDIIEEEEEEKKDDSSESSSSDSEKSEKSDSESEKSNSDSDSEKSDKSDKSDHSDSESHKSTSTSSSSKKKKKKVVKKEEEKEPSPPAELKPKLSKEELEMQHIQAYNEARRNLIASVTDVKKFKSLLNRIQETCLNENEIIAQVFPTNHKDVLVELLLRLMEQIVSKTVENILVQPNVASSDSDALLVYLQNFENIYTECMLFTKELCVNKEIPINESTVTIMIENMFQDRKQNYINVEVGHYDKIHSAKMSELIIEENRVLIEFAQSSKHSSGYFSGLFSSSGQSGITANQAQIINALANASSSNSTNKQFQIPGLKFDIVVTFINENCTALQRCQKLSPIRNLPENMAKIFEVLIRYVGDYIERGIAISRATIENINGKNPPRPDMYQTLQMANTMLQKIQQHLEQNVIPAVSVSLPIQLQCVKMKDDLYGKLEVKVVSALELILKAIMEHVKFNLESEKKKTAQEYMPKESINLNQIYVNHRSTGGCSKACQFLETQVQYLSICLYGRNREIFLSELGSEFYKLLNAYLKGFSVNNPGAIVLMRDLSEYQKCMRRFEVQLVDDLFDGLREMSNVFLVAPQNLENVLSQLDQKKMSKEDIRGFIKMRADFKDSKLNKLAIFKE